MQLKDFQSHKGFTLVEIAVVLIIIGIMASTGIALYNQYRITSDIEKTVDHKDKILAEINSFFQTYGRYPCPASASAAPGSPLYGIEANNCNPPASGTCQNGVCAVDSQIPGRTIMIGSVPFKKLNIQERESYDAYLSRFTYAVTSGLTDADTYNPLEGGISITDGTALATSLVDPPNTAHFVVFSHGRDKVGSRSRDGVLFSVCGGTEAENCDGDEFFVSREIDDDYDDIIEYHTQASPTHWKSDEANTTVSMKTNEIMIVNARSNDPALNNPNDPDKVIIRKHSTDPEDRGNIKVDNRVFAEELCDEGQYNCFNPRRIAGQLTPEPPTTPGDPPLYYEDGSGNGMSCYTPGGPMRYLRGVRNGGPDCTDEIVLECPDGQFISSIVDGKIRCNEYLRDCAETPVTTFCGDSRTLAQSPQGSVLHEYSGECRYITDYDATYFATQTAGLTRNQVNAMVITPINNGPRDVQSCDADRYSSLVRDTYVCRDTGWETLTAHEKLYPWYNFTNDIYYPWSWHRAETGHNGSDPNNNNGYHDCWCREDYRVQALECPNGAWDGYRVQKHRCPQTIHHWETVFTSYEQCSCTPYTEIESISCNAHYEDITGTATTGLSGNVHFTYNVTCNGNTPERQEPPINVDISECQCLSGSEDVQTTACSPNYLRNSWIDQDGVQRNNIAQIDRTPWVCPSTTTAGLPDPGYLDWANTSTEVATDPCFCDPTRTVPRSLSCPEGQNGSIYYDAPIDCSTGDAVADTAMWTETSRDCRGCKWSSGSSFTLQGVGLGEERGTDCSCGSSNIPFCFKSHDANTSKVWTNCQCIEQTN